MSKAIKCAGIAVCGLLVLVLVVNVTIILKSYIYPDRVPDFLGYKPFIVLSGSMEPAIQAGDLIITKVIEAEKVAEGDKVYPSSPRVMPTPGQTPKRWE